jgi:hypothetical protein
MVATQTDFMNYRRGLTPLDIPTFFSACAGVATVVLVHSHQVGTLIELNVLWLAYLALIHLRARAIDGSLLDLPAGFFCGDAIASYLLGLLLSSVYYVVYGTD